MGKAVVSTVIGCEGLDVTYGENILIGDTPDDFAKEVVSLLKDSQRREQIALAGKKLVGQIYDWKIIQNDLARHILAGDRSALFTSLEYQ